MATCYVSPGPVARFEVMARGALLSACTVTLVSCGGGQSAPTTPVDSPTPAGANTTDGPSIALDPPIAVEQSSRIGLTWQASSNLSSFTVLVKRTAELNSEAVDATVGPNSAQFARGASWRLDFPTATVRVRGCDTANQCIESNERPLLDALLSGLARLTNRDRLQLFSGPHRLSADGNTLAVWDKFALGPPIVGPCEGLFSIGSVLVFHRDADGRWTEEASLNRFSVSGVFGSGLALSGDGNTLIAPAFQDNGTVGGINAPEVGTLLPPGEFQDERGAIHVYTRDANRQWSHEAFIKPAVTVANEGFGARVEVTHNGNRVLVGARDRVYLFERNAGQWRQVKIFESSPGNLIDLRLHGWLRAVRPEAGVMAISADGSAIAMRTTTLKQTNGLTLPPYSVHVHTQCNCADGWQEAAILRSAKIDTLHDEQFGRSLSFNGQGTTLAVGAPGDAAGEIDNPATSNGPSPGAGAVYIFAADEGLWQRRAFLKARAALPCDRLGEQVIFSGDGKVLAARAVGLVADLIGEDPRVQGLRRNQPAGAKTGLPPSECLLATGKIPGGFFEAGAYLFEANQSGAWSHTAVALAATRNDLTSIRLTDGSLSLSADAKTMGILFERFPDFSVEESFFTSTIVVY
jgi:hypothetical protein